MSFVGIVLKPLSVLTTTDDTPTTMFTFDLTLGTELANYGYSAISNFQKYRFQVLGGHVDSGSVDSVSKTFEFTLMYESTGPACRFSDITPLVPIYSSSVGTGIDTIIDISIDTTDLVVTITGNAAETWQWILLGEQLAVFPDLDP